MFINVKNDNAITTSTGTKKFCLLFTVCTGLIFNIYAQQLPDLDAEKIIPLENFTSILVPPEQVNGRTLLFPNWQIGHVFLSQGRFASGITFNYDVLNNVLLILVELNEYSLDPIAVDSILIFNRSEVLVNPIVFNGSGDKLLLRIYQGPHLSLLSSTLARIMTGNTNTAAIQTLEYVSDNEITIDQNQIYLLVDLSTKEITEFQSRKKDLKGWKNGGELLSYIKSNDLDLKIESDLIEVIQYYEQLISVQE